MAGAATRNGEIPAFAGMTDWRGAAGWLAGPSLHACIRLPRRFSLKRVPSRDRHPSGSWDIIGAGAATRNGEIPAFAGMTDWRGPLPNASSQADRRLPACFFGARPLPRPSSQRTLGYHRSGCCDPERGDPSFRWDDSLRERSPAQIEAVCSPAKAGAQSGSPPSRGNKLRSVRELTRRVRRGRSGPWR